MQLNIINVATNQVQVFANSHNRRVPVQICTQCKMLNRTVAVYQSPRWEHKTNSWNSYLRKISWKIASYRKSRNNFNSFKNITEESNPIRCPHEGMQLYVCAFTCRYDWKTFLLYFCWPWTNYKNFKVNRQHIKIMLNQIVYQCFILETFTHPYNVNLRICWDLLFRQFFICDLFQL